MSNNKQFSFGLAKHLVQSLEYQAVFRTPDIRIRTEKILLLAKANSLSHSRLGVVIGKKHLKRAVDRNYCKRVVRESFRLNQSDLSNYDIVIVALDGIQQVFRNELINHLGKTWSKFKERVGS